MGERYTKLFSLSEQLYIENAPVIIAAGALLKDNKTDNILVQLKFQNIEEQQIKALTVQIIPLDIKNEKIEEKIEYQYLDLDENRDAYFGSNVPIMISNNKARSFETGVTEVIFKDNTVWKHEYTSWDILEKPQLLENTLKSPELVKQYKIKYGQDSTYTLKKEKRIWYCTCGALNHEDEKTCHKCMKNLDKLAAFNLSELETDVKVRLQEEQKQREKAREELRQKEIKKKKQMYIIAMAAVVVAIVSIAINMAISAVKKKNAYNNAVALMENKKFEEAIEQFEQLDGYKDSAEQITDVKYNQALYCEQDLIENEKFEEAIEQFEQLDGYKDSAEQIKNIKYNQALYYEQEKDYDSALHLWKELGNYKDSEDKYNELEYKFFSSRKLTDYIKKNGNYIENIELKTGLYSETFSGYCLDITLNEDSNSDSASGFQLMLYTDEEDSDNFWCDYEFSSEELNLKDSIYFTYTDEENDEMKFTEYYEVPDGWTSQEGKTYDFRGTFYATIPIASYKMGESIPTNFEVLEYLDTSDNEWKIISATKAVGEAAVTERVNEIIGKLQTYLDKNSNINMEDLGFTIEE